MIWFLVIGVTTLIGARCNTVSSPQIRIVDVAEKAFETRYFPRLVDYGDSYQQNIKESIQEEKSQRPFKSYVIYDDFPNKIFKEWRGDSPSFIKRMVIPVFQGVNINGKAPLPEYYYYYDKRHNFLPPPNPTLAYQSVYSNVIKVFDNSLDNGRLFGFQSDRLILPPSGDMLQSFQPPFEYEAFYPQEFQEKIFGNQRLPENFPKVFVPNDELHFTSFKKENSKPTYFFLPTNTYFGGFTNKEEAERNRLKSQAERIPQYETNNSKSNGRVMLCSLIRLNQKQFPENGGPCFRSEGNPIFSQEYPDYSKLPNDKIPVEHRRQHSQLKRIKRNDPGDSPKSKTIHSVNEYNLESLFGYEGKFTSFNDFNSNQGSYDNYGGSSYGSNRNNKRRNRNRGEYNEYDDDEYQSNDESNSQGLSSYLTNGGRRYRNRQNNDEEEEDSNDDNENNDNNREPNLNNNGEDSNEEMEGQNSYGRSMSRRRNNNNLRGRRNNYNNNNNNDDDDFRDNRRNNRQNSRRYNNKRNNDYSNRNRNSYGYNNNGYSSYGTGSNYGNRGYGNNDYGSGYDNNGYGSSNGYGNNNGYGGSSYGSYNYGNRNGLGFGGYSGFGGYGGYNSGYGSYGSGSGYGSFDHDDF